MAVTEKAEILAVCTALYLDKCNIASCEYK